MTRNDVNPVARLHLHKLPAKCGASTTEKLHGSREPQAISEVVGMPKPPANQPTHRRSEPLTNALEHAAVLAAAIGRNSQHQQLRSTQYSRSSPGRSTWFEQPTSGSGQREGVKRKRAAELCHNAAQRPRRCVLPRNAPCWMSLSLRLL
jgi:hypothetical protein